MSKGRDSANTESVRTIPDEFLGALLGAWIGSATKIWLEPPGKIFVFLLVFIAIPISLNVVVNPFDKWVRGAFGIALFSLVITSGLLFRFAPIINIFDHDNLLWFYWIFVLGWLCGGVFTGLLNNVLSGLKVTVDRQGNGGNQNA